MNRYKVIFTTDFIFYFLIDDSRNFHLHFIVQKSLGVEIQQNVITYRFAIAQYSAKINRLQFTKTIQDTFNRIKLI